MFDASDDHWTQDWLGQSRRFLAYLQADGEAQLIDLRGRLRAVVAVAEATELPEAVREDPSDVEGPSFEFWCDQIKRRFPSLGLGEYEIDGEHHFAFDDLADIAKDLGDAVAQHEAGEADALWEWKFGFDTHWGEIHARPLLQHLARLP